MCTTLTVVVVVVVILVEDNEQMVSIQTVFPLFYLIRFSSTRTLRLLAFIVNRLSTDIAILALKRNPVDKKEIKIFLIDDSVGG